MPQEQRPTEKFRTSVGGQALMEGIMMRGPEKICCAVRRPDGTIDLSYSDVTTHWYNKVPLVRGVCNMVENLMNGYKYLMHSADIAMTEEEKEEEKQNESKLDRWLDEHAGPKVQSALMTLSACAGVVLAIFLFTFLPTFLTGLVASDPHGALAAGHLGSSAQAGNLFGLHVPLHPHEGNPPHVPVPRG